MGYLLISRKKSLTIFLLIIGSILLYFNIDKLNQNNERFNSIFSDKREIELDEYIIKKIIKNNDTKNKIKDVLIDNVLNDINDPKRAELINELRKNTEIHSILWNSVFGKYSDKDYKNNTEIYKDVLIKYSSFLTEENEDLFILSNETKLLHVLHQSLYSWLYNFKYTSFKDLIESFNGKGLVISVGNDYFNYARSTIENLRNIIKSEIPIEIFYNGESDLSEDKRNILKEYDNVYVSDLSQYFNDEILHLSHFALKPFSLLASRFEEVILIDADSVYLRDPMLFFDDPGYIEKGTIFFQDRNFKESSFDSYKWFKTWINNPLPDTEELRIWNEKTTDQMESSTLVINKAKNILGLLAACNLNGNKYKKIVYKHVYGDKETFWIGFEMARQPFYFNPLRPAFISKVKSVGTNSTKFCGHVGHKSEDGKFMFWNGHLINKYSNYGKYKLVDFDIIVDDTDDIKWVDLSCGEVNNEIFKNISKPFDEYENKTFESILDNERKKQYVIRN